MNVQTDIQKAGLEELYSDSPLLRVMFIEIILLVTNKTLLLTSKIHHLVVGAIFCLLLWQADPVQLAPPGKYIQRYKHTKENSTAVSRDRKSHTWVPLTAEVQLKEREFSPEEDWAES